MDLKVWTCTVIAKNRKHIQNYGKTKFKIQEGYKFGFLNQNHPFLFSFFFFFPFFFSLLLPFPFPINTFSLRNSAPTRLPPASPRHHRPILAQPSCRPARIRLKVARTVRYLLACARNAHTLNFAQTTSVQPPSPCLVTARPKPHPGHAKTHARRDPGAPPSFHHTTSAGQLGWPLNQLRPTSNHQDQLRSSSNVDGQLIANPHSSSWLVLISDQLDLSYHHVDANLSNT